MTSRGRHCRVSSTERKIGKHRKTVSKIDEIPIPHLWLVTLTWRCIHLVCLFQCLKQVCTSNQLQPLRGNVRSRIYHYNDRKAWSLYWSYATTISSRSTIIYSTCIACIVLRCILYWPVLDKWAQMNGTAILWKISLLSPNTVSQKDEKPHTSGIQEMTCKRSMMFLPK